MFQLKTYEINLHFNRRHDEPALTDISTDNSRFLQFLEKKCFFFLQKTNKSGITQTEKLNFNVHKASLTLPGNSSQLEYFTGVVG